MAAMTRPKGEFFEQIAWYGFSTEQRDYMKAYPIPSGRASPSGRTFLEGQVVHIVDVQVDPEIKVLIPENVRHTRTFLGVPLIREGAPIGVFALQRKTVRPFTDKQIELVTTFADQAVIAIENARLFDEVQVRTKELTELLEQQTATSEVLQVISSSSGDLKPVFQALLANAVRMSDAKFGTLVLLDGGDFRVAATHQVPKAFADYRQQSPVFKATKNHPAARMAASKRVVQITDMRDEPLTAKKIHRLSRWSI